MKSTELRFGLSYLSACEKAKRWVGARDLETAWNECRRGDWMVWLIGKLFPDKFDRWHSEITEVNEHKRRWFGRIKKKLGPSYRFYWVDGYNICQYANMSNDTVTPGSTQRRKLAIVADIVRESVPFSVVNRAFNKHLKKIGEIS